MGTSVPSTLSASRAGLCKPCGLGNSIVKRRLLACLLFASLCACPLAGAPSAFAAASMVNKRAPEFTRNTLSGGKIDLAAFREKVVLLNFWASWCAPCQLEMPVFAAWQRQYGPRGFQVIGISMDDNAAPARRLAARLKLDYPVAMGDAKLGERYGGVLGLPLSYLIDRNGVVRAEFQGETNLKKIEAELRALIAEP